MGSTLTTYGEDKSKTFSEHDGGVNYAISRIDNMLAVDVHSIRDGNMLTPTMLFDSDLRPEDLQRYLGGVVSQSLERCSDGDYAFNNELVIKLRESSPYYTGLDSITDAKVTEIIMRDNKRDGTIHITEFSGNSYIYLESRCTVDTDISLDNIAHMIDEKTVHQHVDDGGLPF